MIDFTIKINGPKPTPPRRILPVIDSDETAPDWYSLPTGWTWERVTLERAKWDIGENLLPLAVVSGVCVGWGVPLKSDLVA